MRHQDLQVRCRKQGCLYPHPTGERERWQGLYGGPAPSCQLRSLPRNGSHDEDYRRMFANGEMSWQRWLDMTVRVSHHLGLLTDWQGPLTICAATHRWSL